MANLSGTAPADYQRTSQEEPVYASYSQLKNGTITVLLMMKIGPADCDQIIRNGLEDLQ